MTFNDDRVDGVGVLNVSDFLQSLLGNPHSSLYARRQLQSYLAKQRRHKSGV